MEKFARRVFYEVLLSLHKVDISIALLSIIVPLLMIINQYNIKHEFIGNTPFFQELNSANSKFERKKNVIQYDGALAEEEKEEKIANTEREILSKFHEEHRHFFPTFNVIMSFDEYSYFKTVFWYLSSWFMYMVVLLAASLIIKYLFRQRSLDVVIRIARPAYGFTLVGIFFIVMFLIILVIAQYNKPFLDTYPQCSADILHSSIAYFIFFEVAYFLHIAGIEYLFRGPWLMALYHRMGTAAIFVTVAPYIVLKFGKPQEEVIAAIIAGVALGFVAIRTRTFWYGAIIHGLVGALMDVIASLERGLFKF